MLLVTIKNDAVEAQTDTPTPPVFVTGAPVATGTPGGGFGTNTVRYDFRSGQGDFAVTIGTWESGIGFITDTGIMTVLGGYTYDETLVKATFYYSATAAGTMDFAIQEGSPPPDFESSGGFSICATECSIFFSPPAIEWSTMIWAVDAGAGDMIITALVLEFGSDFGTYDVDGDGCPILSEEQLENLDQQYVAACARCFFQPTPVRANMIPSMIIPTVTVNSTLQSTFQIPVIVSGTPQTPTPFTPFPALGSTFTPEPTNTPEFTPTPIFDQIVFDFTGSQTRGWAAWGGSIVPTIASDGWRSVWNEFTNDREYIQIISPGSFMDITSLSVTFSSPFDQIDVQFMYPNADVIAQRGVIGPVTNRTETFFFSPGASIDVSQLVFNGFSNQYDIDPSGYWAVHAIYVGTTDVVTPSPVPTSTPQPTGVPWFVTPDLTEADCSVAVFGDFSPIAQFETDFTVVSVECYTIVPEVNIDLPGESGIAIDGVQWCITWFEFPLIEVLGIKITLDWVMVAVVAFLVRLLLSF